MRKIIKVLMILIFIFGTIDSVSAKTLKDLKNELAAYEKEMNDNKNKQKLTKDEIDSINARARTIMDTIQKDEIKIKETEEEIIVLEKSAEEKEEQIKDIISFLQITNSENAYMEYIFGAQTIEDLVLRSAVSEQMVAYNDDLIEDYNSTIKASKIKNEELKEQIINLNAEQKNLEVELVKLGDNLEDTVEAAVSVQNNIDEQKKLITYYEKTLGCKDDQNINTCGNIPFSGKMLRPLASGAVSSEFGNRYHPTEKYWTLHSGIDMYGSTDVYAVAPGTVAGIHWHITWPNAQNKRDCGGTVIYVHHNINGTYYTSAYMHLYQVKVKVGDYVDQNTKIAVTGGSKALTPWDRCSTGRHLHLSVARGLYLKDYSKATEWTSKLVNPRTVVNFPKIGVWWSNKTRVY